MRRLDDNEDPQQAVTEMALGYVEQIRTVQQHGRYTLFGYSFGGPIATEIARQLHRLPMEVDADPMLLLRRIVRSGMKVVEVDGAHLNMIVEPYLLEVARALDDALSDDATPFRPSSGLPQTSPSTYDKQRTDKNRQSTLSASTEF